ARTDLGTALNAIPQETLLAFHAAYPELRPTQTPLYDLPPPPPPNKYPPFEAWQEARIQPDKTADIGAARDVYRHIKGGNKSFSEKINPYHDRQLAAEALSLTFMKDGFFSHQFEQTPMQ